MATALLVLGCVALIAEWISSVLHDRKNTNPEDKA